MGAGGGIKWCGLEGQQEQQEQQEHQTQQVQQRRAKQRGFIQIHGCKHIKIKNR